MSINRTNARNGLSAEEARWLKEARRARKLGKYKSMPSMVGDSPRKCHDCSAVIPANRARCAPCQHTQRMRNQESRARKQTGAPPKPNGVWEVRACVNCGKGINARRASQVEARCQPCRQRRMAARKADKAA